MLVSNFDSAGSFSGDPPPEVFKNSALLAMAIDAAAAGILRGQVDWHCWSSAMPPHIFLSAHFFLLECPFSPDAIDGRGVAGAASLAAAGDQQCHLNFFGVHTFFFRNALFSPDAINGRGRHRYFARPS